MEDAHVYPEYCHEPVFADILPWTQFVKELRDVNVIHFDLH